MRFVFVMYGWHLGGISTFCRNLSAGLRNRRHEVILLVIHHAGAHNSVPNELFDQCVVLPRRVSRTGPFVAKVAQAIDRLKPDTLVVNASPYAMAALPYVYHSIIRTPVIHVPEEAGLALTNPQWWDRLITVSEFVGESLRRQGFSERVSVCPLGVPLPSARQEPRKRFQGPLRIVSASRIVVTQKRMDRLPAIAKMLAERKVDFHWTVLGDGAYLRELRHEMNRSGVNDRFSFKGSVCESTVTSIFRESDVFILVSDHEGLPQALLEAMAYGVVPVVSRINGSTTCAVEHGKSGFLCDPSEPVQFVNAITQLTGDHSLGAAMSARAAETIAQNFSLSAFTDRFLAIINELRSLENRRAQPLSLAQARSAGKPFQCLGFWRCLRNQTFGQVKRWLVRKTLTATMPEGGGLPPSI